MDFCFAAAVLVFLMLLFLGASVCVCVFVEVTTKSYAVQTTVGQAGEALAGDKGKGIGCKSASLNNKK